MSESSFDDEEYNDDLEPQPEHDLKALEEETTNAERAGNENTPEPEPEVGCFVRDMGGNEIFVRVSKADWETLSAKDLRKRVSDLQFAAEFGASSGNERPKFRRPVPPSLYEFVAAAWKCDDPDDQSDGDASDGENDGHPGVVPGNALIRDLVAFRDRGGALHDASGSDDSELPECIAFIVRVPEAENERVEKTPELRDEARAKALCDTVDEEMPDWDFEETKTARVANVPRSVAQLRKTGKLARARNLIRVDFELEWWKPLREDQKERMWCLIDEAWHFVEDPDKFVRTCPIALFACEYGHLAFVQMLVADAPPDFDLYLFEDPMEMWWDSEAEEHRLVASGQRRGRGTTIVGRAAKRSSPRRCDEWGD